MWLVGAGYWGSRVATALESLGVRCRVIDIRNGQTIDHISDLDPVLLATPLWQHHEQVLALLARGHDVYVEKPAAETAQQVQEISRQISDSQLFMVGHLFQHHPQMHMIQSLIQQGAIGTLQHVNSRRLNWGIYQTRTDPVLSLATHDVSILLAVVPTQSQAEVTAVQHWNYSRNIVPDRVIFQGRVGTVSFDIDVSWSWPIRTRSTVFMGDRGQIVWDQDANQVTVTTNTVVDRRAIADPNPAVYAYTSELSPLHHELSHWVNCVRSRCQPLTGAAEALAVAQVLDQVRKQLI